MPKFDTNVQELKYKVLKEVAKSYIAGTLTSDLPDIPKKIIPGPKPTMRCCIYKERAIVNQRIKLAMGGHDDVNNVVEVLNIACDECPLGGYEVTNRCRGCIAHRCEHACPRHAISFDPITRAAIIDKSKCINCGLCAKACPYTAIANVQRPCEQACKVKAISRGEDDAAKINNEKCIQCGACVYQCPFGAIMDKSYIIHILDLLKDAKEKNYPVYAIIAPSVAAQLREYSLGQLVTAVKRIGFTAAVEAALGADMVAYNEAKELAEKGFLTSSCCPAFVSYIEKYYPTLKDYISHNLSPMATIAKWIKETHPTAHAVFIGPCVAKKKEVQKPEVNKYVDYTMTFEELQALVDAFDIDATKLDESPLDNASYYGRIFARCGGLSDAVNEALKEQGSDFVAKSLMCDGLDNCKAGLTKAKSPTRDFNFIEGMACVNGCIGGPCMLTHEFRNKADVDKYGKSAKETTIKGSISIYVDPDKE